MSDNYGWSDDNEENGWTDDNGSQCYDSEDEIVWEMLCANYYYTAESNKENDPDSALENYYKCIALEEKEVKMNIVRYRLGALKNIIILLIQFYPWNGTKIKEEWNKLLQIVQFVSPYNWGNAANSILDVMNEQITTLTKLNHAYNRKYNVLWTQCLQQNIGNIFHIQISTDIIHIIAVFSMVSQILMDEILNLGLSHLKDKFGENASWFSFGMRCYQFYFGQKNYIKCKIVLDKLHDESKEDDIYNKGYQLLDIYAAKMNYWMSTGGNHDGKLSELYEKSKKIFKIVSSVCPTAVPVIQECWGKYCASKDKWYQAYKHFFDAYKSYGDIEQQHVTQQRCFTYSVVAAFLSEMDTYCSTHPFSFASSNFSAYINIYTFPAMDVIHAYYNGNIEECIDKLINNDIRILDDEFIIPYIPRLKLKLTSHALVKLIRPYDRVKLEWICTRLNKTMDEIERLVLQMISDGKINGRFDEINLALDIQNYNNNTTDKLYTAMDNWLCQVNKLRNSIIDRHIQ